MNLYKTDYPNQLHQLNVSVSKHYWLTKADIIKYQHKPIEISLRNLKQSPKTHLVHYMIRDHFSGVVYSEVTTSECLFSVSEFLFRSWSEKSDFIFCGIPNYLTIPQTVELSFPGTKEKILSLGVSTPEVTSGFQAGIRDVKTLESYMKLFIGSKFSDSLEQLNTSYGYISNRSSRGSKRNKIDVWAENIEYVKIPKDFT